MKQFLRFVAFVMCVLICFTLTACNNSSRKLVNTLNYKDCSLDENDMAEDIVCENENWILTWDNTNKTVKFTEKKTGLVWGQSPIETEEIVYDEEGFPIKNHPQTESAILVNYYDPATLEEKTALSKTEAVENECVYVNRIDNGIEVVYDFVNLELAVPVEFTIFDDCFKVTVRPEKIADNGVNYVTGISVAPFMCGTKNNGSDSWLFIPDGSGALVEPIASDSVGINGKIDVFGSDLSVQTYNMTSAKQQAYLPVFGVKKGSDALLGVIESAAETASISWNIGSKSIKYSSVYPTFRIRGYDYIEAPRGFWSTLPEIMRFSNDITATPIVVSYFSLSGEKASVYGMAQRYREYLIENSGLAKSKEDEFKIALKYVGATVQPSFVLGIPSSKLFSLTTMQQATVMTEELSSKLSDDFYIDLVGFGESGIDIGKVGGGFKISSVLGNNRDIKNFNKLIKSIGTQWFMDFDIVSFNKSGNGFSKSNSVALLPNQQKAWHRSFNTVTREENDDRYFILSRDKASKAIEKLLKRLPKIGSNGVSLKSFNSTKYSDYKNAGANSSSGMGKMVSNSINKIKSNGYKFLGDAPNLYSALVADRIIEAPLYSSQYDISFTDVPFYEIVFKGHIPMNSVSINLCSDREEALLRCIEGGVAPTYLLIYNYENELITSEHSFVFSASYEGNKEGIVNTYNSVKDYYESVSGAEITNYKQLNVDVRITEFDNGVYSVVNYGDTDIDTEYGNVKANSWITGRRK